MYQDKIPVWLQVVMVVISGSILIFLLWALLGNPKVSEADGEKIFSSEYVQHLPQVGWIHIVTDTETRQQYIFIEHRTGAMITPRLSNGVEEND